MNDKETIEVLKDLLVKYPFDEKEIEGIRSAIGLLSWTKLVEGWVERKKKAQARREGREPDTSYL